MSEKKNTVRCPHCGGEINPGAMLASIKTPATRAASIENGKKGGRPPGSKNKRK